MRQSFNEPYGTAHEEWQTFSDPGSFHISNAKKTFSKGMFPPTSILYYHHR